MSNLKEKPLKWRRDDECQGVFDELCHYVCDIPRVKSNADMLVAAPELYAALAAFERVAELWLPPNNLDPEHQGEGGALCEIHRMMRAALAKARGES